MKKQSGSGIGELLKTIIYAVVIALFIRTFVYEPFSIPSGSMKPTLLVGDYLFVSKFSYGYSRYSIPFGFPIFSGRILGDQPERGDVVVFKLPLDNKTDYIKRIIGLPGDRIQMIEGRLHINGVMAEREAAGAFEIEGPFGGVRSLTRYVETLPGGVSHYILEANDTSPMDNTNV
jgi:signal peptidase I